MIMLRFFKSEQICCYAVLHGNEKGIRLERSKIRIDRRWGSFIFTTLSCTETWFSEIVLSYVPLINNFCFTAFARTTRTKFIAQWESLGTTALSTNVLFLIQIHFQAVAKTESQGVPGSEEVWKNYVRSMFSFIEIDEFVTFYVYCFISEYFRYRLLM